MIIETILRLNQVFFIFSLARETETVLEYFTKEAILIAMKNFFMNAFGMYAMIACFITCDALGVVICPKNQYVAKCGDVVIGTNILRGTPEDNFDYYDRSGQNNIENLHRFFSAESSDAPADRILTYTKNGAVHNVDYHIYRDQRNHFLNAYCDPSGQSASFFTCAPCPNGGITASVSSVAPLSNSLSWTFHTFADCYKDKFTDASGTYQYRNENNNVNVKQCRHTTEIKGTVLTGGYWDEELATQSINNSNL